ncbi:methyltransferase, FxLD system [Myceligenerans xiligouense]|uniref:Protein-L-isoaspartate O-methyltransferase n=1 Tax=Myceligenerans xiligouense TaxID=253184 RepID=A0A3N4ZKN6_9MICO|nr:methyltransferase, FxLD system [Myceligenerans xiligouense]RPF21495.1 protein-L-isoaspartate(D-aspartate) O-methyltransferase [Myceligenerans xiligouense]
MTETTTSIPERAARLRADLVDGLRAGARHRAIDLSPAVEDALRTVPRHLFCPPGTDLEAAYADDIVRTQVDETTGRTTSSISAPWLQARMLEQARIEPGMRVLEIGSSGYNAALAAELVGAGGEVVTVDIDPAVVTAAQVSLEATGYTDRVTAICADAAQHLGRGVFDRIIVTMGVWDFPGAWLEQLAKDGILVAPLRVRHPNECWSTAYRRRGDLLVGSEDLVCGFVDVQGIAAVHPAATTATVGDDALTLFAWDPDTNLARVPDTFDSDSSVWASSGAVLTGQGMIVGMRTHLACTLPGLAEATAPHRRLVHKAGDGEAWTTFAHVDGKSVAIAAWRTVDEGHELGARGFGPDARQVAETLARHIADWDRLGRPQRAAHVYRVLGGTTPLDGTVIRLPGGGDLAITLHHDAHDI